MKIIKKFLQQLGILPVNKLSKEILGPLNYKYVRGFDKWYRMYEGIASELINYEDGIIYLEICNTERKKPSDLTTALLFAKDWRRFNILLSDATGFHVSFYKSSSTGFAIRPNSTSSVDIKNLIERLKSSGKGEFIRSFFGRF